MGVRVNSTQTAAATAATYTVTLGSHATNDLLLINLTQDGGGTEISLGNATVTITNASPAVFTYSGSDIFANGDMIVLTTTGSLPTGLSVSTSQKYYVKNLNTGANTFEVSTTSGGASVNTASAGSGTHTAHLHKSNGWHMLGLQARAGSSSRHVLAAKFAASGAESNPVFYGSNDEWVGACHVIRDVDTTWDLGTLVSGTDYARSEVSTGVSHNFPALTSDTNGCLLVYSAGFDGPGAQAYCRTTLAATRCIDKATDTNNANVYTSTGIVQQESAGAAPTVTILKTQSGSNGNLWVLAIPNETGGSLCPDIRPTITELYHYGNFGAAHDTTVTWQAPTSFAAGFNSIVTTSTAPTTGTSGGTGDSKANWGTFTTLASSQNVTLIESPAGSGAWVGGTHTISSTNMTGKVFGLQFYRNIPTNDNTAGNEGMLVGFSDGTNWVVYQTQNKTNGWVNAYPYTAFIALGSATAYASSGSIDWTAVTRVGYFVHRISSSTASASLGIKNAVLFDTVSITGGGASRPSTFADYANWMVSWGGWNWAELNGAGQVLLKSSVQIGDGGTNTTYFDSSASSAEFPPAFATTVDGQMKWNVTAGAVSLKVNAGASDTINLAAGVVATSTNQALTIDSGTSTSADYSFAGTSIVGFNPTWKTDVNCSSATFSECGEIDAKGSDWTDCTIADTISTDAAIAFSEDGGSMTRCTIDVTGTSAQYHLELGTAVTAISLIDVTFTGTPGTDKVHVRKTTGTVTITIDGTTSLVSGDVTSEGATVSIVAPSLERGLEFTGLLAGSQVKVFETGTDTELFSDNSSSTTETWDDATSGSITVDYVIQKAGYLPIRVTGVTVTGAVGTGVQSVPVSQVAARWYQASSGLTINTNVYANATTKLWGLTTTSTVQNLASYLMEQWIALGDAGEAFANKPFPLEANGPNSFTWLYGWEADTTTYPNSIANLSRDGMRYVNNSGTVTAIWSAILSVGVSSGMRVRFQQSDGGTTQSAAVTSGNMDELVQVYGDATHGNFDRTGYLVCKVQEMGYDQAEVDVVAQYGTLEDQLYVIGLSPTANGVATGNPSITGVTITDHAGSPVTWNSKDFSITITDSATNSGTDIIRWLRYNFETGGTFQSTDAFNWHDLVQTNGDAFKTVRGKVYGDTGATLKGVRVLRGSDAHPDFTSFMADDGTTYEPPVVADISITSMPNAVGASRRLQIINTTALTASARANSTAYSVGDIRIRQTGIGTENTAGLYLRCTTAGTSAGSPPTWNTTVGGTTTDGTAVWTTYAVLFYDDDPASTSYSTTYTDGEEFLAGESVEIRFAEMDADTSFKTYEGTTVVSSEGFSFVVAEEADDVYATNALDGSDFEAVFSPNFTDNYIVLDANTDFSGKGAYAYFCYTLTSSNGMYLFWGGVTALDTGNYRIETDVLDMYFDESAGFVKQTDDVRIFRKDGTRPALDPTTGGSGIEINWRTPVSVVETGVSGLTGPESAQLMALPTASQILAAAESNPIHANIKEVNDYAVGGAGTESNPWGPS